MRASRGNLPSAGLCLGCAMALSHARQRVGRKFATQLTAGSSYDFPFPGLPFLGRHQPGTAYELLP